MIETTTNKQVYIIQDNPVFAFGIPFFSAEDIHCYLYDGETEVELVSGEDFTVESKADYSGGANVILLRESLVDIEGQKLTIVREVPLTQDVNLPEYGRLPVVPLEKQLDKLIMICQQLKEITARSFAVPHGMDDYDNDEIYNAFNDMVNHAEQWAEEAQTGANSAADSATVASMFADMANRHSSKARAAETNAVASAGSAANAAMNALNDANDIRAIAQQATLNHVTLIYGDWGADGIYVSYNEWTDAESLITVPEQIEAHNSSETAHSDIRELVTTHDSSGTAHIDIRHLVIEHNTSPYAHKDLRGSITDVNDRFNNTEIRELANTRCWISAPITPQSNTRFSLNHFLNLSSNEVKRAIVDIRLKCQEFDLNTGYSEGDYAQLNSYLGKPILSEDKVTYTTVGSTIKVVHKSNNSVVDASFAKWQYEIRIWY